MRMRTLLSVLACWLGVILFGSVVSAREITVWPRDPALWVNSPPITLEQLRGKAVFLWLFEETCPTCRAKWPSLVAKSREYQNKPIVFIAVNSGNSPDSLREYARLSNCTWPILADVDRSFEKLCDAGEISLENVNQAYWISSEGSLEVGDWSDIDGTIQEALTGAAWKIDPAGIPGELQDTWRAIEFNNYKAAAPGLKKYLNSPKSEIKAAAQQLDGLVQTDLKSQIEAATTAREAGELWKAFELCQIITSRFNGIELPDEVSEMKKALAKEPQVKAASISRKVLDGAIKNVANGRPLTKKAHGQLEKMVTDYPDTELAREAQKLLDLAK